MSSHIPSALDRATARTWAAAAVMGTALALSACGPASAAHVPDPAPTTTLSPTPRHDTDDTALDAVTISGSVTDEGGSPLSTAMVTFEPLAGGASRTAVSDANGGWSLELAPGRYTASCTSIDGDCTPVDAPGEPSISVTVSAPDYVDFVVEATPAPPDDASPAVPPEASQDDSPEAQCRAGGYTVCGVVTMDGKPVPGLVIEAKFGNQNQTVTTNAYGGYGLKLQISVATLLCEESSQMLDNHLTCQADEATGCR